MNDILNERNDILAEFARRSLGGEPAEPVAATGAEPEVTTPEPEPAPVPEPKAEEKVVVKEEPVVEPKADSTSFDDWDSTPEPTPAPNAAPELPVDVLSELGKVLGVENVKGKEDVVKAIATLKEEAAKAAGPDKTKIRPELLKAIELDEKGGDFYEYLKVTSVDYSKADPVELYEDYVIDQLSDANGNYNEDEVNDFLDNMKESEIKLRGIELQKRLVYEQQRKVAEIEQEAIRKREKADAELRSALSGLQEIDGFKVDDKHRREAFDWVASGKMMRDLFYGPDGQLDPVKVAKNAFRNLYYEKLDAYQKSKIRNSTKREVFADLTNQQITTPSIPANPNPVKGNPLDDYIKSLEQGLSNR